jgi:hypothetical protein
MSTLEILLFRNPNLPRVIKGQEGPMVLKSLIRARKRCRTKTEISGECPRSHLYRFPDRVVLASLSTPPPVIRVYLKPRLTPRSPIHLCSLCKALCQCTARSLANCHCMVLSRLLRHSIHKLPIHRLSIQQRRPQQVPLAGIQPTPKTQVLTNHRRLHLILGPLARLSTTNHSQVMLLHIGLWTQAQIQGVALVTQCHYRVLCTGLSMLPQ